MFLKNTILFNFVIYLMVPHTLSENCISCSIASMEKLLQVERQAVSSLENYIKKLEDKIDVIRSGLKMLLKENQKSKEDGEIYALSPFKAFSLIHRLHFDWQNWNIFIEQPIGSANVESLRLYLSEMPTHSDFSEAVQSLIRLQNFYFITANDMTNGILRDTKYDAELSAFDAFAIAQNSFNRSKYHEANEWAEEALRLYKENVLNDLFESSLKDFYALYSEIQLILGNSTGALSAMKKAMSLDPFSIKFLWRYHEMEFINYADIKITDNNDEEFEELEDNLAEFSMKFCRDGFEPKISNLHCRLFDKTNAFLKIAPFKMEEISLDPYVVKFYETISDKEIDHFKEISIENLERGWIAKPFDDGYVFISDYRTSKIAWLNDNETEIILNLNKRISDMTGLNLMRSEPLQVMNYGMAGQYQVHADYINYTDYNDPDMTSLEIIYGDRLSSVLIYMSDVIDGGETIFPNIELVVKPEKGTSLIWYNLNDRGEPDPNVGHIACPVIVGSKWATIKWIREREQFRARPCLAIKNDKS